jgi:hypothetical protein
MIDTVIQRGIFGTSDVVDTRLVFDFECVLFASGTAMRPIIPLTPSGVIQIAPSSVMPVEPEDATRFLRLSFEKHIDSSQAIYWSYWNHTSIVHSEERDLTRLSMKLSENAFQELWEKEDNDYWEQY